MRWFLIKTIFISLPILAVALLLEVLLRNIPNDYLYKKEYLDIHSTQIETLILGSSHSFYGLNPDYFSDNTFNASHISQSLNYDYEILKKYEPHLINLNTIVLPISYFTLFGNIELGSESWRVKNYIIYYGMNTSKSLVNYSEILSNQPSVNIKRLIAYYFNNKNNINCTKFGWGINYKSEKSKDLVETGKSAAKRHTKDDIYSDKCQNIFNNNESILKKIIYWSEKRNIKILFVTPPAFETYRNSINVEQLDYTVDAITKITSEHNNLIYINLFNNETFIAKDFYDADHLSEIGAAKLSTLINDKLNEWK